MTKTIALLGSTGSIGRQTLQVARELKLRVAALAAGSSVELLEAQAREFSPRLAVLYDKDAAAELRQRLRDTDIEVLAGPEGLLAAAQAEEADTVVTAVVGSVGLEPTLAAIRLGRRIALANKETLVCAGELVMAAAKEYGADGIIYQQIKFCDPWAYERMMGSHILHDDYGYPVLSVDRPYNISSSGQMRTRVQAFVESIEIKKIQGGDKW